MGGRRGEEGGDENSTGKVGGREVGRRENFWGGEKTKKKKKKLWARRMCFWFIPKRLQRPHPQLVHWWLLVHSSQDIPPLDEIRVSESKLKISSVNYEL